MWPVTCPQVTDTKRGVHLGYLSKLEQTRKDRALRQEHLTTPESLHSTAKKDMEPSMEVRMVAGCPGVEAGLGTPHWCVKLKCV